MKLMKELNETLRGQEKNNEVQWQDNPSGRAYWVKGKSKEGKDRRWGPFKDRNAAAEFKKTRNDIRSSQVVFESSKLSLPRLADKYTIEVYNHGGENLNPDQLEKSIKKFLKKNGVEQGDLEDAFEYVYLKLGNI